jgi:ABC-2 type transport system ATP-binding protein
VALRIEVENPMRVLSFESIEKYYNGVRAVDGVSFEVRGGEIFGLLGPNGAGKTTLIRILMDILRPDAGRILIDGQPTWQADKDRIGYLPEERGLYRKQRVLDVLVYFGMLKGMTRSHAKERARAALERADLLDRSIRKVEELSKGMQQKVQILATLLHDPDLVVLDEPFSGLDPMNVRLLKETLEALKTAGKIVILSTHQMAQVEALCDRIAMLDRGRLVLYGALREIRRSYSGNAVLVAGVGPWASFACVRTAEPAGNRTRLVLRDGCGAREFLAQAAEAGVVPEGYETAEMPLEEIFVQVVEAHGA